MSSRLLSKLLVSTLLAFCSLMVSGATFVTGPGTEPVDNVQINYPTVKSVTLSWDFDNQDGLLQPQKTKITITGHHFSKVISINIPNRVATIVGLTPYSHYSAILTTYNGNSYSNSVAISIDTPSTIQSSRFDDSDLVLEYNPKAKASESNVLTINTFDGLQYKGKITSIAKCRNKAIGKVTLRKLGTNSYLYNWLIPARSSKIYGSCQVTLTASLGSESSRFTDTVRVIPPHIDLAVSMQAAQIILHVSTRQVVTVTVSVLPRQDSVSCRLRDEAGVLDDLFIIENGRSTFGVTAVNYARFYSSRHSTVDFIIDCDSDEYSGNATMTLVLTR